MIIIGILHLKANNKKVNMNFDNGVFNSDILMETINTI